MAYLRKNRFLGTRMKLYNRKYGHSVYLAISMIMPMFRSSLRIGTSPTLSMLLSYLSFMLTNRFIQTITQASCFSSGEE